MVAGIDEDALAVRYGVPPRLTGAERRGDDSRDKKPGEEEHCDTRGSSIRSLATLMCARESGDDE